MKKVIINTGLILLFCTVSAVAQTKSISKLKTNEMKIEVKEGKKIYTFKSFREKEVIVKAAFAKLNTKFNDNNYPKEVLAQEKLEFISLIKGKVVEQESVSC